MRQLDESAMLMENEASTSMMTPDSLFTGANKLLEANVREAILDQAKKGDFTYYAAHTSPSHTFLFHLYSLEFNRVGPKQHLNKNLLSTSTELTRCLMLLGGEIILKDSMGKRILHQGSVIITTKSSNLEIPILAHRGEVIYLRLTVSGYTAMNALHSLSRTYGPVQELPMNCQTFKSALRLTESFRQNQPMSEFDASTGAYHWFQSWWNDLDQLAHAKLKKLSQHATPENLVRAGLFTVKSYAQYLGHPDSYLSERLRKLWQTSPGAALYRARLTEAEQLLKSTQLSVNEIAERTGYSSASSFIRAFKTFYLATPSDYRLERASTAAKTIKT